MGVDQDRFLSDNLNLNALVQQMPAEEQLVYQRFGHNRIESAFIDRVFVVYKCHGRDQADVLRPPEIMTTIRVVGFSADHSEGCRVRLLDLRTNSTMTAGHRPTRLFDYDVFVSIPSRVTLRWDVKESNDGRYIWSLMFIMFVKSRNKAEFFSKGNTYMETPNTVRKLFPDMELDLEMS